MGWRDRFNATGKFRDAEFVILSDSLVFGRRTVTHEYPQRDTPYAEDLGRKAREHSIDVFVIEPNYMDKRDRLIVALEQPGPGTLVHPYFGTMRVSITNARKTESLSEGGYCQFALSFVESGEKNLPAQSLNTQVKVKSAAASAIASVTDDFVNTFDTEFLSDGFITELEDEVNNSLAALETITKSKFGAIASQVRAPANMATGIIDAITVISNNALEPIDALGNYKQLFAEGEDRPVIVQATTSRKQQATNVQALHNLIQRTAVINASIEASDTQFATRTDAIDNRDQIIDAIDKHLEQETIVDNRPIDDDVYDKLNALRAAVVQDINTRSAALSNIINYAPLASLPALVIANELYGDANRADEIITRNNIAHPGFVMGGEPIEVSDV